MAFALRVARVTQAVIMSGARNLRSSARLSAVATSVALTIAPCVLSAQTQWTLVEELRIGAAETEATTFADVRGIALGTGGQIFVLEFRTQEIRAFDATGKFIKNIARKCAGPGEIASANGLAHVPDGTIWVNDPGNGRFSVFRADGTFLRQQVVPINSYGYIWAAVIDSKNRVNDPITCGGLSFAETCFMLPSRTKTTCNTSCVPASANRFG